MKRVLVLGATGKTGQLVLKELANRPSIQVIAGLRKSEDISRLSNLDSSIKTAVIDVEDSACLTKALNNVDVVVQAIRLRGDIPETSLVDMDRKIRQAIANQDEVSMIIVGGAGSLKKANGKRFWEDQNFPRKTLPRGIAHHKLRDYLEENSFKDPWTYLIPPPAFIPDGKRLGDYQKFNSMENEEIFLTKSISYADFAMAIVDAVLENWRGVYLIAAGQQLD
ncbi:NAD(P)H-binding protein [Tetragenococcus koreensis]|uniref:NADH-flavin reductase n=1 Tax=Tetragenococcus koreensis TaxID=290335 RepID=A0AAN4RKC5_9ENTE|nr:NAD(P)H-binding protein [Tetragenococcus koreensis]MCF1585681.1 NAD(P)H-binding protein [Tetragenococcus koreensis]MCF1615314.1 NAD(P)H-binding protein [Tetragenococcus koreensis]MCF1618674.1 NAD(P)H-binding protein [Tetragenococcus koreensis]MCF1625129.1 NAD(P)H-binding protein [Tetragenococcus koreensis]MCF1626299.1 NAD(P)H-binding protein [Tetragenococcus koreensis]